MLVCCPGNELNLLLEAEEKGKDFHEDNIL